MTALISPLYPWALFVITAVYLGACTFKNRDRRPSKNEDVDYEALQKWMADEPEPLYYNIRKYREVAEQNRKTWEQGGFMFLDEDDGLPR